MICCAPHFRTSLVLRLVAILLTDLLSTAAAKAVDLMAAGATPGGSTPITAILQRVIDEVSAAGGGTVVVPTGVFLSLPVQLRSHVTLRPERGAVLRCTDNPAESRAFKGFVFAVGAEDIAIDGPGTIDGNGRVFEQRDEAPGRPNLLYSTSTAARS